MTIKLMPHPVNSYQQTYSSAVKLRRPLDNISLSVEMLVAALEENSISPSAVSEEDIELYLEIIKRSALYIEELANEISTLDTRLSTVYSKHEIHDGINAMAEAVPLPVCL